MSEQADGFLKMGASYNFEREKAEGYKKDTINPQGFQKWTGENMYKSSYAHFHSKVNNLLDRIRLSRRQQPFQDMEDIYLPLRPKIYTLEAIRQWQSRVSKMIASVAIILDSPPQASILTSKI